MEHTLFLITNFMTLKPHISMCETCGRYSLVMRILYKSSSHKKRVLTCSGLDKGLNIWRENQQSRNKCNLNYTKSLV